jgi:hypothetical protein
MNKPNAQKSGRNRIQELSAILPVGGLIKVTILNTFKFTMVYDLFLMFLNYHVKTCYAKLNTSAELYIFYE